MQSKDRRRFGPRRPQGPVGRADGPGHRHRVTGPAARPPPGRSALSGTGSGAVLMGSPSPTPPGIAPALIYQAGSSLRTRLSLIVSTVCSTHRRAGPPPPPCSRSGHIGAGADIDTLWSGYEPDLDSSNYVYEKREKFRGLHALLMETASICEAGNAKYMQQAGMKSPAQARARGDEAGR